MKIGIVTFTYGDNYGQRFQNYAVQEILKQYADEVFTLPMVRTFHIKRSIKAILEMIIENKIFSSYKRHKAFQEFDRKYISYNKESVKGNILIGEEQFDFFVAGSDQIWSPFSCDVNGSMFLSFTSVDKKIAFSPSIASNSIPEEKKNLYYRYWSEFKYLSIREQTGANLIKNLSGKDALVLIDPTLALDKRVWKSMARKPTSDVPDKYVLAYYLGEVNNKEWTIGYCSKNHLEIINILENKKYERCGPCEFLYLIEHAETVFTDSYHGTIFSILFHTPFVVMKRMSGGIDMSSRFDTLFAKLDIKGRMCGDLSYDAVQKIDFYPIDRKLELERNKVFNYLEKILIDRK